MASRGPSGAGGGGGGSSSKNAQMDEAAMAFLSSCIRSEMNSQLNYGSEWGQLMPGYPRTVSDAIEAKKKELADLKASLSASAALASPGGATSSFPARRGSASSTTVGILGMSAPTVAETTLRSSIAGSSYIARPPLEHGLTRSSIR